jgi:NADP-dependent 3-hydroxy acid dehydrogenase YdfG
VHVIGSKQSSVEKIQKELGTYPNVRFAAVDVRDNAAVEKMVTDCVAQDGCLDYLFNNAESAIVIRMNWLLWNFGRIWSISISGEWYMVSMRLSMS